MDRWAARYQSYPRRQPATGHILPEASEKKIIWKASALARRNPSSRVRAGAAAAVGGRRDAGGVAREADVLPHRNAGGVARSRPSGRPRPGARPRPGCQTGHDSSCPTARRLPRLAGSPARCIQCVLAWTSRRAGVLSAAHWFRRQRLPGSCVPALPFSLWVEAGASRLVPADGGLPSAAGVWVLYVVPVASLSPCIYWETRPGHTPVPIYVPSARSMRLSMHQTLSTWYQTPNRSLTLASAPPSRRRLGLHPAAAAASWPPPPP